MEQREIKFRAWDKTGRDMLDWAAMRQSAFNRGEFQLMYKVLAEHTDNFVIMQFTGLVDKAGKDIYEGDVLRFHYFYQSFGKNLGAQESEHELTGVVEWQGYGYGLSAIKGQHWRGYTGYKDGEGNSDFIHLAGMSESSIHEESFEILGNKFQNPELLNPS